MVIGIDARHLQERKRSGVGTYAQHILRALCLQHTEQHHTYIAYNNSFFSSENFFNETVGFNVAYTHWPNTFLHPAIRFLGVPKIDQLIEKKIHKKIDLFYSPNLHFTELRPHIPHVLTIHDLSFELYPECYSKKRQLWHRLVQPKRQCEQAAAIIVPSWHTKEDIIRVYHIHPQKIHVVYPGIPECSGTDNTSGEEVKKKYQLPEHFFLFIGTIEPRKNIDGIILAYRESGLYQKNIHCIIAGSPGWKYRELMHLMETTPGVRYIGYVDEQEKAALYALSQVCLFPSFYEGFGFPVIEAMQAGVPVITSDHSSLPEVARGAAYLVNPYRIGDIAGAMKVLVSDNTLRETLITKGKIVAGAYSWTKAADEIIDMFDRVK